MPIEKEKSVVHQIDQIQDCTGCAACANACPVGAIRIGQDQEGFYKPFVDEKTCIDCGLCVKTCPQHDFSTSHTETPECYAAMASDELRMKSSSGGIFGLLAAEILKRGGVVCGAAFDETWKVCHIIVSDEDGLEKLRGSKYVESFISENIFREIKAHLTAGKYVLFSGVPCQVAGLKNFLRKDYERLYTVDLICDYAPSPKVFQQYLNENYTDILKINFRSKVTHGWGCGHSTITTLSGIHEENKYMGPFVNKLFKGEHCVNCKFKKFPRPADFTLGDYWRIDQHVQGYNDKKGTSGVLLHNDKAKELFDIIKKDLKKVKSMPLDTLAWQIQVLPRKISRTLACKFFYKRFETTPFNLNTQMATKDSRVGITNWWYINNRGAILTNYALNEMVKSMGYEALTINYIAPHERQNFHKGYVKEFTDKYIKRTRWLDNLEELKGLNRDISTFICGSDQIFNFAPCRSHRYLFYMGWVDARHNKILSYSASFAYKDFYASEPQRKLVEHWLKRFDAHSIREHEGVEIMNNTFGIESEYVLDPVFCIDKQKYANIAEQATDKIDEDFIVYYYTVPDRCTHPELIEHVMRKTGVKKAINLHTWDMSMENWLWYLTHAKFVVTNSFHGVCFSLIFNVPYAVFVIEPERDTRFSSLVRLSGQPERVFRHWEDLMQNDWLYEKVDFTSFNEKLPQEVKRSYNWLKEALERPKNNKLSEESYMTDSLINMLGEEVFKMGMRCFRIERSLDAIKQSISTLSEEKIQVNIPAKPFPTHASDYLRLLANKNKIYLKYYGYKMIKWMSKKYAKRADHYHELLRRLRQLKR